MLSPPDIPALVAETAQYFAERKKLMSRDQGMAQRRNYMRAKTLRRYQRRLAEGTANSWIERMEQETLAGQANYDAALRDIAAQFVVQGEPVPPVLKRYTRKVLHGTFQPKHNRKGRHKGDNLSRDLYIAERIDFIHRTHGIPYIRAFSIVSEALGRKTVRMAISAESVKTVWKNYRSWVRR